MCLQDSSAKSVVILVLLLCWAGIRYIQENDYPVRGTYGFY